jgi:polyisoprenoid-binding protein YceI
VAIRHAVDAQAPPLSPGNWRVVAARSELGFLTHILFGRIPVRGRYTGFDGELHSDGAGNVGGSLRVDAGTIRTGITKRDAHLRSSDYFAVARYPHMTFDLTALTPDGAAAMTLAGTLHVRDHAVAVHTPVSVDLVGANGLRIDADFAVDHRAAGFATKRLPRIVRIHASLLLEPTG